MREIRLEDDAIDLAKRRGWRQWKVQFIGVRGAPDRWFFKAGRLLIVEFKKRDKKPEPQQARRHRQLAEAGFKVHAIDRYEDFVALLDATEDEIAIG